MKKFMLRRLGVAHEGSTETPTLQSCLEAVLGQSDALVDDMLAGLQASLSTGKTKPMHGTPNALARSAIETLIPRSDAFKAAFAASLRAACMAGTPIATVASPSVKFDDFQFLDEDQLDANIEFALTQQEVILAVDDVLPLLNGLISSLMGWITVQAALESAEARSVCVCPARELCAAQLEDEEARAAVITQAASALGSQPAHALP